MANVFILKSFIKTPIPFVGAANVEMLFDSAKHFTQDFFNF